MILGNLVNRPSSTKQISATFIAMDLILVSLESPKVYYIILYTKNTSSLKINRLFEVNSASYGLFLQEKSEICIYFFKSQMWTARLIFIIYTFLWCKNVWNLILIPKHWNFFFLWYTGNKSLKKGCFLKKSSFSFVFALIF